MASNQIGKAEEKEPFFLESHKSKRRKKNMLTRNHQSCTQKVERKQILDDLRKGRNQGKTASSEFRGEKPERAIVSGVLEKSLDRGRIIERAL